MIYILKFERKLGNYSNPRAQAQYYVGWCHDGGLDDRIREHRAGRGAAITRHAVRCGIAFSVVATLPGDRAVEKQLKRMKNTPRFVSKLEKGQAYARVS